MEQVVLVAAVGGLLLGAWVLATRRHLRRRNEQGSDWAGAGDKPDLWTSGARCRRCGRDGGLLEMHGDQLEFVCLSCGDRHPRANRG